MERRLGRGAHPVFEKLADGFSKEDAGKAARLVDTASRQLSETGTIVSFPVQVLKRTGESMSTVYVAHSTDSNPERRISVSFRDDGGLLGMWHGDKEEKKALGALRSMGYKA